MLQLKFESGQRTGGDGAKRQIVPMVDGARKKWKFTSVQANRGFYESIWMTTGDRVQTGRKE